MVYPILVTAATYDSHSHRNISAWMFIYSALCVTRSKFEAVTFQQKESSLWDWKLAFWLGILMKIEVFSWNVSKVSDLKFSFLFYQSSASKEWRVIWETLQPFFMFAVCASFPRTPRFCSGDQWAQCTRPLPVACLWRHWHRHLLHDAPNRCVCMCGWCVCVVGGEGSRSPEAWWP